MISTRALGTRLYRENRLHVRPLLSLHVYFAILVLALLGPISAWLLTATLHLSGESMIGNVDLLRFVLTPAGLVWVLASGSLAVLLIFLEHAGMMLIAARDDATRARSAWVALWQMARRLPRLLELALIQVSVHLLLAAPFLLLLSGGFVWLLGGYDIYYVIHEQPSELWLFVAWAALMLAAMLAVNGSIYLRWMFALPAMLLEGLSPRAALGRSSALTRGSRLHIAGHALSVAVLVALLPLLLSMIFDLVGGWSLGLLPERYALIIPVMTALILSHAVLAIVAGFIAVSANSLLILELYQRRVGRAHLPDEAVAAPAHTGLRVWGVEALVVLLAVGQSAYAVQIFDAREDVAVSAHRGSSMKAPENTLAAIAQAIEDGADYVELDVRQTADGQLVLLHDRDLLRVANVPLDIWNVTFEEIRNLDVGGWFAPEFSGERVPTLEQAVALLRGRAQLYLEIKTSARTPDLTGNVVRELQRLDFVDQTLVAALDFEVLREARAMQPGLRTSLLVHTAIGQPETLPVDAVALRDALVTEDRLRRLRRHDRQVHVWTVNDRRQAARLMDLGVDNIITDRPDMVVELRAERAALSDAERLLLRLRNWVW
ncbi:MAG: glycerophosphodiester phosphodiesterase [Pseudomonadales bacterium]